MHDLIATHILAFQITFIAAAAIALLGAATSLLLVRDDTITTGPAFGWRSQWISAIQRSSPWVKVRPADRWRAPSAPRDGLGSRGRGE